MKKILDKRENVDLERYIVQFFEIFLVFMNIVYMYLFLLNFICGFEYV